MSLQALRQAASSEVAPNLCACCRLSVWVFLKFYALNPEATTIWPGVTIIFQTTLILGSALLFFLGRTPTSDGTSSGGYGGF